MTTKDVTRQVFARRVREERERTGLSQAEFARQLSVALDWEFDPSSVTRVEQATRGVKLEEAVAIAEVLDVPLAAMVRDREALDDEIDDLRRDLATSQWRASQAQATVEEAQEASRATQRRIAELEAARGG